MGGGQGRCEQRSKVFVKIQKKNIFCFWGGRVGRVRVDVNREMGGGGVRSGCFFFFCFFWGGGVSGCERRIEVFEKIQFFFYFFFGGGGVRSGGRVGGQVGCERRIEVFVKIQKNKLGGGEGSGRGVGGIGLGVRVDVTEK